VNASRYQWLANRHADTARAGAAEAPEDPRVEANDKKEDTERNQLDQRTPVRGDEWSEE
jgi:hypothetical protein